VEVLAGALSSRAVDFAQLRHEYETRGLEEADLHPDPLEQFRRWYGDAQAAGVWEPNAMTVATVDADGVPQSRYVLLRGLDAERGFQFYTNYASAKGHELAARPTAAITFGWLDLHRQVRAWGPVRRLPQAVSDAYFAGRPRPSQISAWASPQSEVLADRAALDGRVRDMEQRFAGREVPRPSFWGGYLLRPNFIEFWQGRPNRLHDRIRYRRAEPGAWVMERLSP
jgi:pyridoxamine 5'-phosphate oxidase